MAENQAENNQPAIVMQTQYIKDLSLEIPHAPEIFKNLGGRRAGIGGSEGHACLIGSSGDGFVAAHKCFHMLSPFLFADLCV